MNSHTRRRNCYFDFDLNCYVTKCAKLLTRQIQSVNKRHQYVKNPTPPPSQNGFGVNSAAKILQFFELCKENVCFYAFGDIFRDFRSQKNGTQQDGVE